MRKYLVLLVILIISTAYLGFDKYLTYRSLHNEWIIIYGDKDYFIESRLNLFKLRELLKNTDMTVRKAIWEQFKVQANYHSFPRVPYFPIEDCSIQNVLGNLHTGILLLQVRCIDLAER